MKKRLLILWGIIIVLVISCYKPKEQPNNTITIDQINMDAFAINNILDDNAQPIENIVEIFKLDSINMISDDGVYIPWDIRDDPPGYLPEKGAVIKLTNKTLFEYISSFSWNPEAIVKIFEDSSIPFYKSEGSIGGAVTTYKKFYYTDNNIVMHVDREEVDLSGFTGEESEEELERMRQNETKLSFDAIFVKVIEDDDLSKQDD